MHHASNEKQKESNYQIKKKSERSRKGNLQIRENIGSWLHQTKGDERKKLRKSIPREQESYSRRNFITGTLSKE